MFKFLNLQPEIFAIDLNDSSVKVVKLEKRKQGFLLRSYNELQIEPNIIKGGVIQNKEALVEILRMARKTVKGKKIEAVHVIVSLPEEKSFSQIIQMPVMEGKELQLALRFEAENYIPLPIDSAYMDFQVISPHQEGGSAKHLDVLVNVMPKYIADSYVECFKEAGLVPCIMEIESQAIARALVKAGQSQKPVAIIDLGKDTTSFIIFSGNAIRFTTSVPFSSKQLTVAMEQGLSLSSHRAEELKMKHGLHSKNAAGVALKEMKQILESLTPLLEDFVGKIKTYLSFYRGHSSHDYFPVDATVEKIILCGGGANLKGLPEFLEQRLNIPVELGNPFTNIIPCAPGQKCPIIYQKALSYTTAFGLALRAADQSPLP